MISRKWLNSQATAPTSIRQCAARLYSSSSSRRGGTNDDPEDEVVPWPKLQRRSTPSFTSNETSENGRTGGGAGRGLRSKSPHSDRPGGSRVEIDWTTLQPRAAARSGETQPAKNANGSSKNMLVIRGLSKSLAASDFHRIAPRGLSSWKSSIKMVQQQRDPKTLEPLGIYQISFSTAEAASAYQDKLVRLHRAARQKALGAPSTLWESALPSAMALPSEDLPSEVDALTIVEPSHDPPLSIARARTSLKHNWHQSLGSLIKPLGHGPQPPVVMLEVVATPGLVTPADVNRFIKQDGRQRDSRWRASQAVSLLTGMERPSDQPSPPTRNSKLWASHGRDVDEKLKNRYVMAFETEWEARRFHRAWNQRKFPIPRANGIMDQCIIQTSIINW